MSKKIKIGWEEWSEAEFDLISAKEVASMLSTALHQNGHKHYSDVAFAIERSIESALVWIEGGRHP